MLSHSGKWRQLAIHSAVAVMLAAFVPAPLQVLPTRMIDSIKRLGLQTSLQFCIDAGDVASYSGSGQTVQDMSDQNHDFTFGPTTGTEATDPTFIGVAGRQSSGEYWLGTIATRKMLVTPRGTWSDVHKNGSAFTAAFWHYHSGNGSGVFSTLEPSDPSQVGIAIGTFVGPPAGVWGMDVYSLTDITTYNSDLVIPTGQANFLAISLNEATGAYVIQTNGTTKTGTQAYTSTTEVASGQDVWVLPSSSASTAAGRLYNACFWTRALSATELLNLYNATKAKFGH